MTVFTRYITLFIAVISLNIITVKAMAADLVVVDMAQLEMASNAGKGLHKSIKAKGDALKAEVAKQEKSLGKKQEKLLKDKKTLSAEDFATKAKAFEKDFKETQIKFIEKRKAFEKSAMKAKSKLRAAVVDAVGSVSTTEGYKLVLSRQSVVIVEKSVDITSEVMKKLNNKVKSIPLK